MISRAEALASTEIIHLELPTACHGVTVPTGKGFLIVLNSRNGAELDRTTLEHEIAHIRLGHAGADTGDVGTMEQEADYLAEMEAQRLKRGRQQG